MPDLSCINRGDCLSIKKIIIAKNNINGHKITRKIKDNNLSKIFLIKKKKKFNLIEAICKLFIKIFNNNI